jgi:chemotaxis protein MotB
MRALPLKTPTITLKTQQTTYIHVFSKNGANFDLNLTKQIIMKSRNLVFVALLALVACVPQRQFEDVQKSYKDEVQKNVECTKKSADLQDRNDQALKSLKDQTANVGDLTKDTTLMGNSNRKLNMLYGQINDAYQKLLDKQKELESGNRLKTQELSGQLGEAQRKLSEKEVELTNKEANLNQLNNTLTKTQEDLVAREKRVKELSDVLNKKDSTVKALKNTISDALNGFKDKGLTVSMKNGKVYVSVEDKLLFQSGKYALNNDGRTALLQLATALNAKPDVNVMVEGHTDNVPYKGNGTLVDNLDLSAKRATEVARILTNDGKMDPARVIAAGRGDTQPVASNDTPEGKAKNRRTEIILTPNLGELFKVLGEN